MLPIATPGRWAPCLLGLLFVATSVAVSGCSGGKTGGKGAVPGVPGAAPDTTPPTVTSTAPAADATSVALNARAIARFSEAMNAGTVTGAFTLAGPGGPLAGSVSYSALDNVAEFLPTAQLTADATYTATISTGAKDAAGNSLASAFTWSFKAGATVDTSAPTVTFTFPTIDATNVAINTKVSARFSEAMSSAGTFTLDGPAGTVAGLVSYDGVNHVAEFLPSAALTADTAYTARVGAGAKDLAGNSLASTFSWGFKTGAAADTAAPTVTSTNPVTGALNVPINATITAVFSEPLDTKTVTSTSFTLQLNGAAVAGSVVSPGTSTTATFTPSASLSPNSTYTATLTTALVDMAGNALASNVVWTFQTSSNASQGPAPVNLGTAGNFAILAKSGVSTTGTTAVVGDVGLSPAAGSFLTGFALTLDATNKFATSAVVTGQLFAADYAAPTPTNMTTAVLDMQTAYTDAAGRTLPDATNLGAGNLNGLVIAPGLYKWGTGVLIPSSLTLNGGANDTWIFQIAGDLTVGNGAIVTLTGGALPKNVVWQVAGQSVLGTTSDFKGIILCQTLIAFQTGSVLNGRALAQTAVTLDATNLTKP